MAPTHVIIRAYALITGHRVELMTGSRTAFLRAVLRIEKRFLNVL